MDNADERLAVTTAGFADIFLQLPLYAWQARTLLPIETWMKTGKRQNVACITPNGSGKDERIIPTAIYYWLYFNPRGRVILTTKSDIQLDSQTLPNLKKHWPKFGWPEPIGSPRFQLRTPTGGNATAFVTNDVGRVEGHHERKGEPLLMIVNEAKNFDLWEGIDRCTPSVLMIISSPGAREGRLYEACTSLQNQFTIVRAGLADCPHIPKEKIDYILSTCEKQVIRSTLHGEFMEQEDGEKYLLTSEELEGCINFPPVHKPGFRYGFFDFGGGEAEHVLVIRDGNKFTIADAWKERNEDATVGRSIVLLRRHNLGNFQWGADAASKDILDKMAAAGFVGHRQNFGAADKFGVYQSWAVFAWTQACKKIKDREVIVPDDKILRAQLTSRRRTDPTPAGKLTMEDKHDMEKRNVKSPDRADAFVGCAAAVDMSMFEQKTDRLERYNNKHSAAMAGQCVGL